MSNHPLLKWISSIVAACVLIFSAFLFLDSRYFHTSEAGSMEIKLAGALNQQMMRQQQFYEGQQRIIDMSMLDQLRTSKALLQIECKRNPNDELIKEKLEIIDMQIKSLEKKLYGPIN